MSKHQCCVWDFTLAKSQCEWPMLLLWIKDVCKKWCVQVEQGNETGYEHYQGRVSFKLKIRVPNCPWPAHWSVTSKENYTNNYYCSKDGTRIEGPWKDTDEEIYIPRQIREITKLYPYQEYVIQNCKHWNTRTINIVLDYKGNTGKSTLKGYMRAYKLGRPIPFCNDFRDILRMVMDMPTSNCYLIDMPRAIKKEKLFQFYAAIESIKDGYAYDDRYAFKEKYFDCPNIWVFTNVLPEINMLSIDRWCFWGIDSDYKFYEIDKNEILAKNNTSSDKSEESF